MRCIPQASRDDIHLIDATTGQLKTVLRAHHWGSMDMRLAGVYLQSVFMGISA